MQNGEADAQALAWGDGTEILADLGNVWMK